jgi:hypothetical protein
MLEAALLIAGLAAGFAAAWALGGNAREQLAASRARAEEQERAAEEKLAFAADAKGQL